MKHFRYLLFGLLISNFTVEKSFSLENRNLNFSQISTKEGLSQNTVRAILEDRLGFIWAGTLDGLNRYDGYGIITYKPELGNVHSLIDHRIKDVYQDKDGYLWIKTYKNEFCCYDPVSDSFIDYYKENVNISRGMLYASYYEASNGDIWLIGNNSGCLRLVKLNGKISPTPFLQKKTPDNKKNSVFIFEDSQATIWLGGDSGLFSVETGSSSTKNHFNGKYTFTKAVELQGKIYFTTNESYLIEYDMKLKRFTEIKFNVSTTPILSIANLSDNELIIVTQTAGLFTYNTLNRNFYKPSWANDSELKGDIAFIVDEKNGIWFYNHTGIVWYYHPTKHTVKKLQLIPPHIAQMIDFERYNILLDSRDMFWITTYGNGLFCYNPTTETLQHYQYKANENSLASDYLLSITEDHYGNIWLGSEYAGIIKVSQSNFNVRILRPEQETSVGKNNNVRTTYKDANNTFWVGTKNGSLYAYDNKLEKIELSFKDINPYAIAEDADNNLWVGTKGKGLYIINKTTHKLVAHYTPGNKNSISHNIIFSIRKDSKGRMWLGSFGGGLNLAVPTPEGLSFKHFFFNEGNRSYVRYVFQDSKGTMWLGSSDGVICFNPDELIANPRAFVAYRMNIENPKGLNCNDVKTIYEDKEGTIWIGTAGGGISQFVPASKGEEEYFVPYTTKNGLSGDVITGIMEDNKGNLWIGSESGITRFDKKTGNSIIYNFSDKTYQNYFNENANAYTKTGYMLWGSLDGLVIFNPESFVPDKSTPPVILTNFHIFNQPVKAGEKDSPLSKSISYTNELKLSYKMNTFTIEFASLGLTDPHKGKYMFILEKYDKQWNETTQTHTATYKNLPPGKYIFKVKGVNNDGIWNEKVTQLVITVKPPFWSTWYAYVFYFLLIVLALYATYKLIVRFNTLNNNIRVEKELTNFKLRFFTNISHEFRTPLTLIKGAVENLNDKEESLSPEVKKQINVLSRNSTTLTKLIDQLLEFRKIQNNVLTLNLEKTDIIDFSKDIYNSFQELADRKEIRYTFVNNIDSYEMYIDRRKVDKILYNLLSNAFKFVKKSGAIELNISIDTAAQSCQFSVKDNGKGIDKEKHDLLFSRFMQINFSASGTGVGLSLVKEFVEAHKGRIWYEDNPEESGAVFKVELSTNLDIYNRDNFVVDLQNNTTDNAKHKDIIPENESVTELQLPVITNETLSAFKILIIDDNDDIRDFLTDEFSKHFMVDTAENGAEGYQKAIDLNPDLIICDVMMPEMDGFEVTRLLKDNFETCHIPIILLTAHSSVEHQVEGIQSGADAYIMKPFSLKFLTMRVFKLIEQREQLKKRFSNEYVLDGSLITKTDQDKEFFNIINAILDEHLTDSQFSVDQFAELAKQRRTIFYKKVKGITGLSPNDLIKTRRLKKAAELLLQGELTVSEVAYQVGFEDPFYFSKCFKAQYNCSPSKYGEFPHGE